MELGQRIKNLRQAAGLSQKDVAKRAGIDRSMLTKIERYGQNPSLEMLRRIASGLGCSVVDLLNEEDKKARESSVA